MTAIFKNWKNPLPGFFAYLKSISTETKSYQMRAHMAESKTKENHEII